MYQRKVRAGNSGVERKNIGLISLPYFPSCAAVATDSCYESSLIINPKKHDQIST